MKAPLISIIIACYNGERYIKSSIEAVSHSLYLKYEIIVLDDASQDKSPQIIKEFERKNKVKGVFSNENKGPARLRNQGAFKAKGKYLLFLDMDCLIDPGSLGEVVKTFENQPKIGGILLKLFTGKRKTIDNAGCYLSILGVPYELGNEDSESKFNEEKEVLASKTAGVAIRKKLFNKIGGFDEDYKIHGEDFDLTWRLNLIGSSLVFLPTATGYHIQKGSFSEKTQYLIFYEGTKNNLSNLIKNLPLKILVWMVPLHFGFLLVLFFKLILERRFKLALGVSRGAFWNAAHLKQTLVKRSRVRGDAHDPSLNFILGPAAFKSLIVKGWRWLKNV